MNSSRNTYRYHLETRKLTGRRQQKFQCPHCGKKKCFVRYVDTHNGLRYVADTVGKCDHQHSCGYHYKPSEYYHDNQWAQEPAARPQDHCKPIQLPPFQPMPVEYVHRSLSADSVFCEWLETRAAPKLGVSLETIRQVCQDYLIGATRRKNVIFWQVDQAGQVHGGHIMQYRVDGHRCGFQGWTHIPLIRAGLLPPDWQLYQCFFGQHQLASRPDAHVCVVESEKTAVVMAACQPEYVWLATAGSGGLSPERVSCLVGRSVTLFPDSGCYDKWAAQMKLSTGIDYTLSDEIEAYPPNTDLCDLILGEV